MKVCKKGIQIFLLAIVPLVFACASGERRAGAVLELADGSCGGVSEDGSLQVCGEIARDVVWSGKVLVLSQINILPDVELSILPGTVVRFRTTDDSAAEEDLNRIYVDAGGKLLAKGKKDRPIVFTADASAGKYFGVEDYSDHDENEYIYVRIENSGQGLALKGGAPKIENSRFINNGVGLTARGMSSPEVRNCFFSGNGIGILVSGGSSATIVGGEIADSAKEGVRCDLGSSAVLAASIVRNNKTGFFKEGMGAVHVVDTVFEANKLGFYAGLAASSVTLEDNAFRGNDVAVKINRKTKPIIKNNIIESNQTGIFVGRRSAGIFSLNRFFANKVAIACQQSSSPLIKGNVFKGNDLSVACEYSSYPVIERNNFLNNNENLRLGANQSYEWSRLKWREEEWLRHGETYGKGIVSARMNYWGEKTTELMEAGETNMPAFFDRNDSSEVEPALEEVEPGYEDMAEAAERAIAEGARFARDLVDFIPFSSEPFDVAATANQTILDSN